MNLYDLSKKLREPAPKLLSLSNELGFSKYDIREDLQESEITAIQNEVKARRLQSSSRDVSNDLKSRVRLLENSLAGIDFLPIDEKKVDKKIADSSEIIELVIDEKCTHLKNDIENTEISLSQDIENIRKEISILDAKINNLFDKLDNKQLFDRVDNLTYLSDEIPASSSLISLKDFEDKLSDNSLYYSKETISKLYAAIQSGKPILLMGPPGTGKSKLGKILPQIFLNGPCDKVLSFHEADETWSSGDIVGEEIPFNGFKKIHLGHLSEAIFRSIENSGNHWIFIDEFNRCDPDRAFSSCLDMLSDLTGDRLFHIPFINKQIRVPENFRIICAMNDSDRRHLFPISEQLLKRFTRVEIDAPPSALEITIVKNHIRDKLEINDFSNNQELLNENIEVIISYISKIRAIGHDTGAQQLLLGVRDSIAISNLFFIFLFSQQQPVNIALDKAFEGEILSSIENASSFSLQLLLDEVFNDRSFKICQARLIEVIRQRKLNYL